MNNSKYRTYISEMYGYKVNEFLNKWQQSHSIIKNHNLSIGLICEEILREFLRQFLPDKVGITQGFIENNRCLSNQCDIILYNKIDYAPLYSFGGICIIPAEAVIAIVEVKATLNYVGFRSTLESFERLYNMGIRNKYLFAFQAPQTKTIQNWFFRYAQRNLPKTNNEYYCGENPIDKPDLCYFPTVIIDLQRNLYLQQGHIQTNNQDMHGYCFYDIHNTDGLPTSCLQYFLADIISSLQFDDAFIEYSDKINDLNAIKEIRSCIGFGLCDI